MPSAIETGPTFSRRRPKLEPSHLIVPRVRHDREIRLGHEKIGCPQCNCDCWVSAEQVRLMNKGASITCRECLRS